MHLALFFFLKIALAIHNLLWFHKNFRIVCSFSVKSTIGILIGIALGSMNILTIFILPNRKHGISFHLFMSSSISFIRVL